MKTKLLSIIFLTLIFFSTTSTALPSDFVSAAGNWRPIVDKDHTGEQKLLTVRSDAKEQIYLYWMSPKSETTIQAHPNMEDVVIVQGSLYWLNEDISIQKKLVVGDAVDRKSNIKHGPFRAGSEGCLMYVRFHA